MVGYSFVHTAVGDHSRLAYSEVLTYERKETAAAFRLRANAFFAADGITRLRQDTGFEPEYDTVRAATGYIAWLRAANER